MRTPFLLAAVLLGTFVLSTECTAQLSTRPKEFRLRIPFLKAIWPTDNSLLNRGNRDEVAMECVVYHADGTGQTKLFPEFDSGHRDYFEYHTNTENKWVTERGNQVGNVALLTSLKAGKSRIKYRLFEYDRGKDQIGEIDIIVTVNAKGQLLFATAEPQRACVVTAQHIVGGKSAAFTCRMTGSESKYDITLVLEQGKL